MVRRQATRMTAINPMASRRERLDLAVRVHWSTFAPMGLRYERLGAALRIHWSTFAPMGLRYERLGAALRAHALTGKAGPTAVARSNGGVALVKRRKKFSVVASATASIAMPLMLAIASATQGTSAGVLTLPR
jgi:hypothetical protein